MLMDMDLQLQSPEISSLTGFLEVISHDYRIIYSNFTSGFQVQDLVNNLIQNYISMMEILNDAYIYFANRLIDDVK